MLDELRNNDIVITKNKKEILKKISQNKKILSVRIMNLEEFKKQYFGTYKKQAIYYLINKYHYKYEVAKMYLDHFYFLKELKEELEGNDFIIYNPYFKTTIKRIVIFDYLELDHFIEKELQKYEVIYYKNQNHYIHPVYEFDDIEEEISHTAIQILKLLEHVKLEQIKLVNVGKEYEIPLKRIFSFYNIPINIWNKKNIYSLKDTKKFMEKLKETKNLEEALKELEQPLYDAILEICNDYLFKELDEVMIYCIEEELKQKTISINKLSNAVEIMDITSIMDENNYYFILGFNQGMLPKIYKNEDYFNDDLKEKYGIMTSLKKNLLEKKIVEEKIIGYPHIYLSYKLKSAFDTFYKSSFIEELNLEVLKENKPNYHYSNLYNKIMLAKKLDHLIKYNEYSHDLSLLYHNYHIPYLTYNNQYRKINKDKFKAFIQDKLLLSYSSLDNFYKCKFRYYLTNILKLDVFENTFMTYIGNLFHDILSKAFLDSFDFEKEFKTYIQNKEFTSKEWFFIQKLKKDLLFTIEIIKKQDQDSLLTKALYEQSIYVNKDRDIKITFKGIIDKLKYEEKDNQTIVTIIDYKTGNPNIDLNHVINGLDMQLPIYLYLTKHSKLMNVQVGGFYLQKIIHNKPSYQFGKDINQEVEKSYRLEGYSIDNEEILKMVDKNYSNSQMIKGMKLTSKGFYAHSKVLTNTNMECLEKLVDDKIEEAITDILNVDFVINPKKIDKDTTSCDFCKFKDICYKKEEDMIILKEQKYQNFLGGEKNA